LTARGVAQAEAIGRRLCTLREAEAAEIVASPIGRARRTAEIIRGRSLLMVSLRAANLRFDERTFHSARETDSFRERDRRFESLPSAGESVVRTGDIGNGTPSRPGAVGCAGEGTPAALNQDDNAWPY